MQNKLFWVVVGLIIAGIILLIMSFVPVRAIIQQLPVGKARSRWKILSGLIFMFLAGYVQYGLYALLHGPDTIRSLADIVVITIFFWRSHFCLYGLLALFEDRH